jgi:hypothetical protein
VFSGINSNSCFRVNSNSNSCFLKQFQFLFFEAIPIRVFRINSNSNSCVSRQFQSKKYCHPIHTDFPLENFTRFFIKQAQSKPHTVYFGRVCPAAGCKTNFQICIEVTVATVVEFQHTRPRYTVCGLLLE